MTDFLPHALGADLLRFLGVIGFLLYVANYTMLSLRILHSDSITYFAINIAAAALVLLSLTQDFNLASAMIQTFWIVLGIPAILLRMGRRRSDRRAEATRTKTLRRADRTLSARTPSAEADRRRQAA